MNIIKIAIFSSFFFFCNFVEKNVFAQNFSDHQKNMLETSSPANLIGSTQLELEPNIDCILIKKNDKIIIQEGDGCNNYYSPNSTFKIALAVMGFDTKILTDDHSPIWQAPIKVSFLPYFHSPSQSPSSWMRFSVVWYSQILTKKMGEKLFYNYVDKLNFGNKDLSGDKEKNNGITNSWLSSSLKITPWQQIDFIEKLAKNKLPVTIEAQEKTKSLIKLMEESVLFNHYHFHGKTGSADFEKINRKEGYFVGFANKDDNLISFCIHVSGKDGNKNSMAGGIYAKRILLETLLENKNEIFIK